MGAPKVFTSYSAWRPVAKLCLSCSLKHGHLLIVTAKVDLLEPPDMVSPNRVELEHMHSLSSFNIHGLRTVGAILVYRMGLRHDCLYPSPLAFEERAMFCLGPC
jgi:hypothetical protein